MVRQILEDGQKGINKAAGIGFNEVILMLSNTVTTAEVYLMFDDLRFSDKGDVVTFMDPNGTHLHMNMENVKEVKLIHRMNEQGLPSYAVWFQDESDEPVLRIYLRKSEQDETNQPRHELFMLMIEKYGNSIKIGG